MEAVMRRRYDPPTDLPGLCVHYWLCSDQRDQVVHAVCKRCGAEFDFPQEPYLHGVYHRPQLWYDPSLLWMANQAGVISGSEASY